MNQPPGTLSQRVRYFDEDGRSVAVIHRYKLPDGTLGASGLPDPVAVLEQGTIFAAPSKPNPKKKRRGKRRR